MALEQTEQALRAKIAALEARLTTLEREQTQYLSERAVIALMSRYDNARLDMDTFYQLSGVRFQGDRFVVCSFSDECSEPGSKDMLPVWESLNSTFYQELVSLIRPSFQAQAAFVTANFNGRILGLVNLSDSLTAENYSRYFLNAAQEINARVYAAEGFRFRICISPIGRGVGALPELRENVEELMEYRAIMGELVPEVLFYHSVTHPVSKVSRTTQTQQNNDLFSDYINRGDFAQAKALFRTHILTDLQNSGCSANFLRFRVAALLDYMTQTLTRASVELGLEQVLEELNAAELLLSARTLEDIEATMDKILDALEQKWSMGVAANPLLAQQARAYIDENYQNCELNVSMVANHLHVSASHLTRMFRRCYQTRVLDYIQQVRLTAAKRLLSSGLSLREIAKQVGYGAQINMTRAFKRAEGKTPSEFSEYLHGSGVE